MLISLATYRQSRTIVPPLHPVARFAVGDLVRLGSHVGTVTAILPGRNAPGYVIDFGGYEGRCGEAELRAVEGARP